MERQANVTQGETHGPEQEPRWAGEEDPAVRDPRPDGPMDQHADEDAGDRVTADPVRPDVHGVHQPEEK